MHILWLLMGLFGAIWILWDTYKQGDPLQVSLRWAIGAFLVPAAVIPYYIIQANLKTKRQQHRRTTSSPQDITSAMLQRCHYCGEFYQGNPIHCPSCKKVLQTD